MQLKTTVILLVLVILGGSAWFFAGDKRPADETAPLDTPTVTNYLLEPRPEADAITRITVAKAGTPEMVFESEGEDANGLRQWQMTAPVAAKVEDYMVRGIATTFLNLRSQRNVSEGAKPTSAADAGVDTPEATFTLVDHDGKSYAFVLGKKVALSEDRYVRVVVDGKAGAIHIVGRNLQTELDRKPSDYRSKTLYRVARNDAVELEIAQEDRRYHFTRGDDAEWIIDAPIKTYAEGDKLRELIGAFANIRVADFVEDAPQSLASFGLEKPALSVKLRTETEKTIAPEPQADATSQPAEPTIETVVETYGLAVGDFADLEKKQRYIKLLDQPWVATATAESLDKLFPKLGELRDTRVVRVMNNDVTSLRLAVGEVETELKRTDSGGWQGGGDLTAVDRDAITGLLTTITGLHAIDFIDAPEAPSTYGLGAPRATVTLETRDAVDPIELRVGDDTPSGQNAYIQVGGQGSVLVVAAQPTRRITADPVTLRSREILTTRPDMLERIEVQFGGQTRIVTRDEFNWKLSEPEGASVDAEALRDLTNDLANLRAKRVVARDDFARYGLDAPDAVIHLTRREVVKPVDSQPADSQPIEAGPPASEPATRAIENTLRLAYVEGAAYCRLDDAPYIFELDRTVYPVLTGELASRTLTREDPTKIVRIEINHEGAALVFAKVDGTWEYEPDPYVKLDSARVDELAHALLKLRVQRYLAYSGGDPARHGLDVADTKVVLRTTDDRTVTLWLSNPNMESGVRLGALVEDGRIFEVPPGALDHVDFTLTGYMQSTEEAAPAPPAGG